MMKQNGWQFDFTNPNGNLGGTCSQGKWHGWSGHADVGTLSTTLKGSGFVTVDFGNCWDQGVVKLYLDDKVISTAHVGDKRVVNTFFFTSNSVLKLKDEGANSVVALNSIAFDCGTSNNQAI